MYKFRQVIFIVLFNKNKNYIKSIGSGKSHFCFDLFEEEKQDPSSRWTVICQDKLGSRQRCINDAREALTSGHRVIIDRCNGTMEQRKIWLDLAKESWQLEDVPPHVFCINFDTDYDLCVQRCNARDDHPTIKPGEGAKVVACQAKDREPPTMDKEDFAAVVVLREGDSSTYADLIKKLSRPLNVVGD